MFEANTHWHCSADNNNKHSKTYVSAPLGNRPSQANITFPGQTNNRQNVMPQLVSIATSHLRLLWRRRHTHTHTCSRKFIHLHHTNTDANASVCATVPHSPRSPQLEICDWNRNENKNNNSSVNTRKKLKTTFVYNCWRELLKKLHIKNKTQKTCWKTLFYLFPPNIYAHSRAPTHMQNVMLHAWISATRSGVWARATQNNRSTSAPNVDSTTTITHRHIFPAHLI